MGLALLFLRGVFMLLLLLLLVDLSGRGESPRLFDASAGEEEDEDEAALTSKVGSFPVMLNFCPSVCEDDDDEDEEEGRDESRSEGTVSREEERTRSVQRQAEERERRSVRKTVVTAIAEASTINQPSKLLTISSREWIMAQQRTELTKNSGFEESKLQQQTNQENPTDKTEQTINYGAATTSPGKSSHALAQQKKSNERHEKTCAKRRH